MAEIAARYADRVDRSKMPCVSHWNVARAEAATMTQMNVAAE